MLHVHAEFVRSGDVHGKGALRTLGNDYGGHDMHAVEVAALIDPNIELGVVTRAEWAYLKADQPESNLGMQEDRVRLVPDQGGHG